jgi:hypothetical protein
VSTRTQPESHPVLACDFLCVDTIRLRTIYVLFFSAQELAPRRPALRGAGSIPAPRSTLATVVGETVIASFPSSPAMRG